MLDKHKNSALKNVSLSRQKKQAMVFLQSHCKISFQTCWVFCMSQLWYVIYVPLPVAKQSVRYIFSIDFCIM